MRLMMLHLVLFTFSFSYAWADPIVNIDSDKSTITDFNLSYFIDDSAKLKFEDIQSMEFEEGKNRGTLGANVNDVWIKIKLFNATSKNQILFLHQDLAYTFVNLEYFELNSSNNIINKQVVSVHGPDVKEQLNGSDAVFKFTMSPQESKTIYVHQITSAYHFYNYYIFSKKESIEYLIYEKVDAVLLVGLLLALAMYNFLIFLSLGYKEYLYYTLYLVSSTLWIFYMYGSMAHYFHIYGEISFRFNFGLMLNPIFLAFFVQAIFNTKTEYKTEHKFLNSIIVLLLLNFIFALINFSLALQVLSLSLNYAMLMFLGVAISIYLKGNKIIKIFLFAHLFYVVFNIYGLLFYIGMVDSTYISSHGIGIGIVIEALLLSYLVSYKFKSLEQDKKEEKIKLMNLMLLATTDPMTELYNRRYFTDVSQDMVTLFNRKKEDLSLIIIDIDKFKSINDSYGHLFGDDVINSLADRLRGSVRSSDIICRYGGDEFVILLPECSLETTVDMAQKICKSVESSTMSTPLNEDFQFTISVGVAQVDVETETNIEAALKRADTALYKAKEKGRNRVFSELIGVDSVNIQTHKIQS
jgi:diguanylate cyclase (GGDEF)-like protein